MRLRLAFALTLFSATALAQTGAPLPPNYKVILDNDDVQVQRVHYGPHESVPMHDHPAVSTIYVYLNNSGVVDIVHEKGFVLHRPPTHTGAFRVSPGAFERHAIQNTSDLPSDFLRIELKRIPVKGLPAEVRQASPAEPYTDRTELLYDNPLLRMERTLCITAKACNLRPQKAPSVLVTVPLKPDSKPAENPSQWLPANVALHIDIKVDGHTKDDEHTEGAFQVLRILLPKH